MTDPVLNIIRETLLHENTVESLVVCLATGEVILPLLQPDERFAYPEHALSLTFSGVESLGIERDNVESGGEEVLGIECRLEEGHYRAEVTIGRPETPAWALRLVFSGLRYQRSPRY